MWPRLRATDVGGWITWRYRRAQRCWSVESRAQKSVTTRLRNQSEFTQTAEAGGDDCRAPDWAAVESGNKFFWLSTTKTATAAANSPVYIIQTFPGQFPIIEDERWKDSCVPKRVCPPRPHSMIWLDPCRVCPHGIGI